jgi:hypothetical protein
MPIVLTAAQVRERRRANRRVVRTRRARDRMRHRTRKSQPAGRTEVARCIVPPCSTSYQSSVQQAPMLQLSSLNLAAIPHTIQSTFGDWSSTGSTSSSWQQPTEAMAQQASMVRSYLGTHTLLPNHSDALLAGGLPQNTSSCIEEP